MTLPARLETALADLREEPARFGTPRTLLEQMRKRSIPGVGCAVVAEGRIEWAGGFGVRDADLSDPVTAETLFQAGSISKPVAALCALRLVAEGELDLDEDVNERLTSWRIPDVGAGNRASRSDSSFHTRPA